MGNVKHEINTHKKLDMKQQPALNVNFISILLTQNNKKKITLRKNM